MISLCILTLSDRGSKGLREDLSGTFLRDFAQSLGWRVLAYEIIPDELDLIRNKLKYYIETLRPDLILTTGGTGLHPRDVTPEATLQVVEKLVPGIQEYIRFVGFSKTPLSALSRGVAGIKGETLIINLPGSPKALKEIMPALVEIIEHAVAKIKGDPSECARN